MLEKLHYFFLVSLTNHSFIVLFFLEVRDRIFFIALLIILYLFSQLLLTLYCYHRHFICRPQTVVIYQLRVVGKDGTLHTCQLPIFKVNFINLTLFYFLMIACVRLKVIVSILYCEMKWTTTVSRPVERVHYLGWSGGSNCT